VLEAFDLLRVRLNAEPRLPRPMWGERQHPLSPRERASLLADPEIQAVLALLDAGINRPLLEFPKDPYMTTLKGHHPRFHLENLGWLLIQRQAQPFEAGDIYAGGRSASSACASRLQHCCLRVLDR
jgi:hypothetical protein